jgi:ADP-ribosyl-[dinitrogen reductase] hydrolase
MNIQDRFAGCLLGLAAGDAVGTTVEFKPRGSFAPLTGMAGGGPFSLRPGEWTDDTSMALCLATSLVRTGRFDPVDQMERYCRWREDGYLSSNGRCFDIGNTTSDALDRFGRTGQPVAGSTDSWAAGNGSIMRLAPVPMFYHETPKLAVEYAAESSHTTHAADECVGACRLFAGILLRALAGCDKEEILAAEAGTFVGAEKVVAIARGEYRTKGREAIRGSGYVVESLEAALWCFHHTGTFEEAILEAANLGDDADTTAAVCGQVAGAHYGADAIPADWLQKLALRQQIVDLAMQLLAGPRSALKPAP